MKPLMLRGIPLGPVVNASGARNFFCQGWGWRSCLTNWSGSTFVAKTTTLEPRTGNMPLRQDLQPKDFLPKCIVFKWLAGAVLNAVGLSGPGARALLASGQCQTRQQPFVISFAAVKGSMEERLGETAQFVALLKRFLPGFQAPIALEINFSCPNLGLHGDSSNQALLVVEILTSLEIASLLGIPLIVKINALITPQNANAIAQSPYCDALTVSNTIPWGQLTDDIPWVELFGSSVSPLQKYGGGGLSGKPILPVVRRWLKNFRKINWQAPIIAGGGIFSSQDALGLKTFGANAFALGVVGTLRPWRVQKIIRAVNAWD